MLLPKEGTLYCHVHTNLEINKLRKPCNLHQNTMQSASRQRLICVRWHCIMTQIRNTFNMYWIIDEFKTSLKR